MRLTFLRIEMVGELVWNKGLKFTRPVTIAHNLSFNDIIDRQSDRQCKPWSDLRLIKDLIWSWLLEYSHQSNLFLTCPSPSHPQGRPCPSLIYLKYIIHISLYLTIGWQPNWEHRIWNHWYSILCVTASIMLSNGQPKMFTCVRETRRVNSLSTCHRSGRAHCRVIITARSQGPKCPPSHKSDQVPTIQSPWERGLAALGNNHNHLAYVVAI